MAEYIPRLDEWVRVSGQVMEREMADLQRFIGDIKGCIAVELGSCQGRATCAIALACEVVGGHVYTIDHFKPVETGYVTCDLNELNKNLSQLRLTGLVTIIKDDSTHAGEAWSGPRIDLWFHDASHFYDKVKADILAWKRHIKPGGLMAFHDYTGTSESQIGVSQAANELLGEPIFVTSRLGVFRIA